MKKKILAAMMAACMVAGLVACGTESAPATSEAGNVTENNAEVGDVITFGKYEQDGNADNGAEAIEWIVVDKKDGKALLLSKMALMDTMFEMEEDKIVVDETFAQYGIINYHYQDIVTIEEAPLIKYLNGDFYNNAFSDDEKALVVDTEAEYNVSAYDKNYNMLSDATTTVSSKVFLLNYEDVEGYYESYTDENGLQYCDGFTAEATVASGLENYDVDAEWYEGNFGWLPEEAKETAIRKDVVMGKHIRVMWGGSVSIECEDGAYDNRFYVTTEDGMVSSAYTMGELINSCHDVVGVRPAVWVTVE